MLVEGLFIKFKLTKCFLPISCLQVKDKEGLTNSSTQIVNIEAEDDNRPR